MLIRCLGHQDPFIHIHDLISKLSDELTAIVFHGANNAVAYLGSVLLPSIGPKPFDVVFCDNLAGAPHPKVTNAVRLCDFNRRPLRSNLPHVNSDE